VIRPKVTVVCSTHGRSELLPRLVGALSAQTMPADDFEVVVVDDASPDDTSAVLERLAAGTPFALRILRHARNRGAAAGRNTGWRAAAADVVAFTDDDCVPGPGWLEAGVAAMDDHAGAFVVGRTEPDPDEVHLLARPFSRSLAVVEPKFYETCNVFYRRRDLEAVGGFDEQFRTGEDTDLGLRMREAGRQPVWEPAALVRHRVRPASFAAHWREARRWADLALVVKRHPGHRDDLLQGSLFWKRTHPPTVVAVIGVAAAAATRSPVPLLFGGWWVWHRLVVEPACPGPRRRIIALPGTFVVDATEVATMAEGSARHRTLLL
jgi:GT2 family glycosyltransferase